MVLGFTYAFAISVYLLVLSRGHMVVGFITPFAISAYHHLRCSGEVYSIHHYVIKFVSDLRLVGGFLWVLHQ
jgi:hypothetical protein